MTASAGRLFAFGSTDPSLQASLADEERAGLRFALIVRALALAAIVVWLLISVPFPRVAYWLCLAALFLVSGLIPYLMRHRPSWRTWVIGFTLVDAAVLVIALLAPNPLGQNAWPIQMGFRFHNDLYLFVLLAGAALSYSPLLVLLTGVSAAAAWGLGALVIAKRPESILTDALAAGDAVLDSNRQLEIFLEPTFVNLTSRLNELVLLLVTAAIIAAAVWRARRLVLRQVETERSRANIARYVSPDLVDQLARQQRPLEASQHRKIAVLFVDMVGFTRLAEEFTPEETIVVLRSFHRRMADAVFACGGTVDKYTGDSVMATFGALGERPDDAARALHCACAMLDAVDRWNAKRAARGARPVQIGIGVHYGPVVVGNVGDERHLQFTVVGDTVNVASRLERLSREHGTPVLTSAELIAAADASGGEGPSLVHRFESAGSVHVRGRRNEVRLWRITVQS